MTLGRRHQPDSDALRIVGDISGLDVKDFAVAIDKKPVAETEDDLAPKVIKLFTAVI